jgi:hypothetical protein
VQPCLACACDCMHVRRFLIVELEKQSAGKFSAHHFFTDKKIFSLSTAAIHSANNPPPWEDFVTRTNFPPSGSD